MHRAFPGTNWLIGRLAAGRLAVVGALLLALVVQGFVTQTHMHGQFAQSVISQADQPSGHGKIPPADDPANCPICQQIVHASQFVAPAWLTPFLLVLAISTIEIADIALPRFDTVSHSWRGRGPPLH